jgi:DNA-binding winged helix-turn-helix (wHTH) protein
MPMSRTGMKTEVSLCYRFGRVEFDSARFELRVAGRIVVVQRRPLEVLALLLERAGEIVTKEELIERVWQGRPLVDNVLASALTRLRGALAEDAAAIMTHHRVGYRFCGIVERVAVQTPLSELRLRSGDPVPGRRTFVLDVLLDGTENEIWLARHASSDERRMYKLCADPHALPVLEREVTRMRALQQQLGARTDFVRLLDWNFDTPPFFLEYEYGGECLARRALRGEQVANLPLDVRLDLLLRVADALAAVHSVNVLHEGLTPAAVLIGDDPARGVQCVRLTGFGVDAHLSAGEVALYRAPELFIGGAPTPQSDV